MTDPADTLAQVRAASLDTISKAAKAEFLRERGWRPEGGGKTKKW
jgi:RNA 3'-terminal phosphate cyclase